jgi:hypothetical protein
MDIPKGETPAEGIDEIDPYLISEEISDKLKLLDYEAGFCRVK